MTTAKVFSDSRARNIAIAATLLAVALSFFLSWAYPVHAQDAAPAATDTCAGVTVTGTQETVNAAMARLGCTYVAPQTPSGIGQDNTCRVTVGAGYTSANVRSGPGTSYSLAGTVAKDARLEVLGHNPSGTWTKFKFEGAEGWIYSPLCEMVPDTIETAPRTCNAYLRADGFQMDWAFDENGTKYDVTILNTAPTNADGSRNLCWPYRVIQDGAGSSIINDRLPQPPGSRTDAPEIVDWTFLGDDWEGVQYAYYSGIAGRLLIDKDKSGPGGYEAVFDVNGQVVQFSENGEQKFVPVVGGWYAYQCLENCAFHWGFRIDRKPWSRP